MYTSSNNAQERSPLMLALHQNGLFDLDIGFDMGENGIYFNTVIWEWHCRHCYHRLR
jgi:hypothetical protein